MGDGAAGSGAAGGGAARGEVATGPCALFHSDAKSASRLPLGVFITSPCVATRHAEGWVFCRLVTMKPNTGSGLQARSGGRHDGGGGWEGEGNVLGEREHPGRLLMAKRCPHKTTMGQNFSTFTMPWGVVRGRK